jgi:nucleoside 2-deoxyribosyltransferase
MKYTFEKIDESDTMLIDVSEKGIGLGIECGYGYAKKKRIIVIHKKGTELSTTIKGISSIILEYKKIKDVAEAIKNEHI